MLPFFSLPYSFNLTPRFSNSGLHKRRTGPHYEEHQIKKGTVTSPTYLGPLHLQVRHRHKDERDATPGHDYILFTELEWERRQVSNFSNSFSYFHQHLCITIATCTTERGPTGTVTSPTYLGPLHLRHRHKDERDGHPGFSITRIPHFTSPL
jgi:hypothetical protein